MQLSLTKPGSWTLLLLLISHLLLWENVTSVPMCAMRNGRCFVSLKDMFDIAGSLSHEISKEVSGMFTEFEKTYGAVHRLRDTAHTSCHTSSLPIPENKGQAMNTHYEVLLKSVKILLGAWKIPLQHLEEELSKLTKAPASIVSKAKYVKEKDSGLLEGVKSLHNMINTGDEEYQNYPAWSGLESLKSNTESVRILAFYNTIRCLDSDYKKIDIYLNVLKCNIFQLGNC